jgi:hypothetical protein
MALVANGVRSAFAATLPWQQIENVDHLSETFRRVGEAAAGADDAVRVLKLTRDPINRVRRVDRLPRAKPFAGAGKFRGDSAG